MLESRRPVVPLLSIGEIADRSVSIAAHRWRALLVLVAAEAVPIGVLKVLLPRGFSAVVTWFVADVLICAWLYATAVVVVAAPAGAPLGPSARIALRRYGTSLATMLLSYCWITLWIALATIAAVVAATPFALTGHAGAMTTFATVGGAVALVLIGVRPWLVATTMLPIAMLEHTSAATAFARAHRRVRCIGFVRSWLLGLAVVAVTVAPVFAVGSAIDAIPGAVHLGALRALEELLSDAISLGLGMVVSTVVALEMRSRVEGADLELALDEGR